MIDADTDEIHTTAVACRLLDLETCRCRHYKHRRKLWVTVSSLPRKPCISICHGCRTAALIICSIMAMICHNGIL
ncbi:hypothetical protein [Endozoicomonas sp. YOMI1]|uniref:hypothetical protein n=1 Tax=Endozoicomonas sp. YOMI1 TaxID=2828739 RepID=UPI00359F2258